MTKNFINLSGGDPDVEAPKWAVDAAINAIKAGGDWTHYAQMTDHPEQFKAVVVDYYKQFGPEYDTKQVLPTAGSTAALYVALASVLKEGDEALLWNPFYAGHKWILDEMGVKMNLAPLDPENNYRPKLDEIADKVTPKTKAVIICNPGNPTGTVFNEKELRYVTDLAIENDMAILSDEIYLHYVYDDAKFISTASISEEVKERTINIMSFSKTFSMTGWRLGYDIVPEMYLDKAQRIAKMTGPRPAHFVYAAGMAALKGDFGYVEERRQIYQGRRDYFCKAIDDLGFPCHKFEGAFYAWFDARSTGLGSQEFVDRLHKEENCLLSPGSWFGTDTDGYIRVPLVRDIAVLTDVVDRVKRFTESL
ncbi:pyridoxal phosphate-dependent aminotransferase [Candidatus Bathyarchaeota archaeon]|jgi:aminotransferase|nr:pyridoxal phosphate-dependent aminotransferase [Candidatus Bathyarchaeota archaeon]MBT4320229.1 pyridoxal phosphate-dependent aminotransferase [Candidatus Bathyarchaeota archaeon]MBT4423398.1 pyridoxal phosphate-dependent aminotransferase [Candidatus Bathyarchaeota archaeon]MBT5641583.1 pyridoxal phosphate-dependent aminotransferase [Candidatus Bathyarchaeota archaeon]MBT7186271.1 pyridoxal phosphate-dependent aminotransferase [Candidatus Bathyarchaeota archaeon]